MIKFSEFFNEWLYGDDGYYFKYFEIGKSGDFYTSVSSSKFFGGTIGRKIVDLILQNRLSNNSYIVEIGAHKGYLLADIIQFVYTLKPELLKTLKFAIVERFEHLRKTQQSYFKECFGDEVDLIHFSSLKEMSVHEAFIVANEIFDAFPCELIYDNKMAYVDEEFHVEFKELDESTKKLVEKYNIIKGEVAIGYEQFAKELFEAFEKGYFLTFDYGEKEKRGDFSIRIYKSHEVYPFFEQNLDLKALFKTSDITYDLFFTHLIDSFCENGFQLELFKTQNSALVEFGIVELLEILKKNVDENSYIREMNKVKTLLHPTFLGERFKAVMFSKGVS